MTEIIIHQKIQRGVGIPHPSGRVESGTELKGDVIGADPMRIKSRGFDQGSDSRPRLLTNPTESVENEDPVLTLHAHIIGDRP